MTSRRLRPTVGRRRRASPAAKSMAFLTGRVARLLGRGGGKAGPCGQGARRRHVQMIDPPSCDGEPSSAHRRRRFGAAEMLSVERHERDRCAFAPLDANASARRMPPAQMRELAADQPPFRFPRWMAMPCAAPMQRSRAGVIGSAPAGHPFAGTVGPGEAVRIFTGGVVPDGADAIVIQENVARDGDRRELQRGRRGRAHSSGRRAWISRPATVLAAKQASASRARDLALLAAGDRRRAVAVRRRPRDRLRRHGRRTFPPGRAAQAGGIVGIIRLRTGGA